MQKDEAIDYLENLKIGNFLTVNIPISSNCNIFMKNKIREIRENKGITQTDLSQLTGLSVVDICHLERGSRTNPSYNTMVIISKALNTDVAVVFEL